MIGPSADMAKPGFKQMEFGIAAMRFHFLQQEHGGNFFFENLAAKQFVCNLRKKPKIPLAQHLASHLPHGSTQSSGVPSVRSNLVLEEPLHARSMLSRATLLQQTPDLSRNF